MNKDNAFSRSWKITKAVFKVMRKDKELFLFPLLGGIFSILFLIALLFPTIIISLVSDAPGVGSVGSFMMYLVLFVAYFGLAFIATFFNVCVVYTVKKRFEKKNATFAESIKFAVSRIHLIFLWSLVSATVGLLLRILDDLAERMGLIGEMIMKTVVGLLGMAWGIITVFVVPSMVYHNLGPIDAIKKSAEVMKKTWGESIIRYVGLGIIQIVLIIVGVVLGIIGLILVSPLGIIAMLVVALIAVTYIIAVIVVFSVMNTIFNTALFVYADTGKVPAGFDSDAVKGAYKRKEAKGNI